ncbi:NAD(+)--dinitrogen-reductase ADP-D-ribosyltransferase [Rhodospirillaceae bacterium LM-1]|nr:NAD(+)--dinitrogen-reductase ADP-D-ribosyltransferase [Rhodospirillaceae bacterium LM-1]
MARPDEEAARGHSTNLVGIPTGLLASVAYNDYPVALHIAGVRETNKGLFQEMLPRAESIEEAAWAFQEWMGSMFGLEPEQLEKGSGIKEKKRFRSSYLRLLKGWGFETNTPEGAVMKGWVESRFGLFPTFHKEPVGRVGSKGWVAYTEEKMSSRFHSNSIYLQLDLLYEFCQWSLARFFLSGRKHLTLYRGVNSYEEQVLVERIDKRTIIVRLNNLNSFSSSRDIAGEFGDHILEALVPASKILFFNALLPTAPLKGEHEYMVIGGDFRVTASYF